MVPGPILSVIGYGQTLSINLRTESALKKALVQVAKATNAWIMTNGVNCGVAKLVGDAVKEGLHEGPVFGIAPYSKILDHNQFLVEK